MTEDLPDRGEAAGRIRILSPDSDRPFSKGLTSAHWRQTFTHDRDDLRDKKLPDVAFVHRDFVCSNKKGRKANASFLSNFAYGKTAIAHELCDGVLVFDRFGSFK
jgi:hypothetical protein